MGDRCYTEVRVRRADVEEFERHVEVEGCQADDESTAEVAHYEVDEANYGMHTDRDKAADAGCVFTGWHGNGGEYGPMEFAAADGKMAEVNAQDSFITVPVTVVCGKASIAESALAEVQEYLDLRKRAEELMKEAGR